MGAIGANKVVLLEVQGVKQFPAIGALGPEIVGKVVASFRSTLEPWFIEDAHEERSLGWNFRGRKSNLCRHWGIVESVPTNNACRQGTEPAKLLPK